MKNSVVVVIPVFYETKEQVKKIVSEVLPHVNKIILVDDGSPEDTIGKIKSRKVVILRHLINLGQGAALQTGFEYTKKMKADIVVTFDSDGQFVASEITRIVEPIIKKKADVVLGSRFLGSVKNIPVSRERVLKLGRVFTQLFTGLKLTDTHNGFRAFSKKAIEMIDIKHNRWAHPSDILYQIATNKFKVVEVPITVIYSKYSLAGGRGQSSWESIRIPVSLISRALLGK